MKRPGVSSTVALAFAATVLVAPAPTLAAEGPVGLSSAQVSSLLDSMPADERAIRSSELLGGSRVLLGYVQMWVAPDGSGSKQSVTTTSGTRTTTSSRSKLSGKSATDGVSTSGFGEFVYNGLYISISVEWDSSIRSEYRYPVTAYFDWQGTGQPWNGRTGTDGLAVYWGNQLALLGDFFWGKYRDGSNLQNLSRSSAPPNQGVGWKFWEAKANSPFGSIADYGYMNVTAARANFTNFITNFTVEYIHTWATNNYTFLWGAGPSVSFTPSSSSESINASASIRT
ncbi:MAG: hypothetical protein HYX55_02260 [Chloroflexi bacterium]|nr:hypothetical protein [Chloroflexota bacterium]